MRAHKKHVIVARRNWIDPNWRHQLSNALMAAIVVAILSTIVAGFGDGGHRPIGGRGAGCQP
jgi:hypothetical protein